MSEHDPEAETVDPHVRSAFLAAPATGDAVRDVATRAGWKILVDLPRGFRAWRRQTWKVTDMTEMEYAESHEYGCAFVTVYSDEAEQADHTLAEIGTRVALVSEADVLGRLTASAPPPDLIADLLALAALRTGILNGDAHVAKPADPDPGYLAMIERLAGHPNRQVRRALIIAVADWLPWCPDFAEPLLARRGEEAELAHLMEAVEALHQKALASYAS